jgi:hypothetical protein
MNSEGNGNDWYGQIRWWLLYSLSWISNSALAFWLMLQLRINLIDLNNALGWGPWILIGVDKFGFLFLGLTWLVSTFTIEIYLRNGRTFTNLLQRSRTVFLITVGGNLASYGLQWLLI